MIKKEMSNRILARCSNGQYMEKSVFKNQDDYLKYVSQLCERYHSPNSDIAGFRIYICDRLLLEVGTCH